MRPIEFDSPEAETGAAGELGQLAPAREVPPLGERIRAARTGRGASVRALAREVGVSPSLISQIENDKSRPSVSTLYAITSALGVAVEDLLGEAGPGATTAAPAVTQLSPDRLRRVGPVIHPGDREQINLDSGVSWQLLGQVPGHQVEFLLVTYAPGASSSSSGLQMRHPGTEYGFLISGELVLALGFEEHRLSAGDSISFESPTPHAYRNEGTEPAVGVWFVTPG